MAASKRQPRTAEEWRKYMLAQDAEAAERLAHELRRALGRMRKVGESITFGSAYYRPQVMAVDEVLLPRICPTCGHELVRVWGTWQFKVDTLWEEAAIHITRVA